MSRLLAASALVLTLAAGSAQAQSYTAPAGIPAAAAPGNSDAVRGWSRNASGTFDGLTTGSVSQQRQGRSSNR
ncbi:hypothetical protein [Methylobacterium gnaphalii]|uniref:Uncharacterized protein n=1 Tax=Methylobacterium gnaphalii TaxID=1010610 RepID=A0A512JMU9_9HYPH|nr:hypothetical protein [Methylobacterium gnaphalii]GEP11163.1 hypothetical protein MGN01_30080 [Methylobacterium gnaphalii]GJD70033.1 hypothetical protein MMMDOFMJ_2973 [Methylobacterium gnaphalii]